LIVVLRRREQAKVANGVDEQRAPAPVHNADEPMRPAVRPGCIRLSRAETSAAAG